MSADEFRKRIDAAETDEEWAEIVDWLVSKGYPRWLARENADVARRIKYGYRLPDEVGGTPPPWSSI